VNVRKRILLWSAAGVFLIGLCAAGVLFYLVQTDEAWERRLSAAPHVARGYLRQWRPTPVMPTPPPASADERARLLQGMATLAPTAPLPGQEAESAAAGTTEAQSLPPTLTPPATGETVTPTATPSPTTTGTPTATPFPLTPVAGEVLLDGVQHAPQMWNNCGPTTIAMNLSFFGIDVHQREPASVLKPNPDDKNVSPRQLAAYAESQGFETLVRMGGTLELLQQLLSNGVPVIVEDWILPEDNGGMGHYRLLTGYDAGEEHFIAQDSYFGPDEQVPFDELRQSWRVFNRKYLVVYRPQQAETVQAILGAMVDDEEMLAHTLSRAQADVQASPDDAFAWFNLGATYTHLGQMEQAASAFDEARRIGLPLRMLWYQFEIFEAYLAVGRYQDVADLGYATAYSAGGHEEAYYYQGLAYAAQGRNDLAVSNLRKALDYNPNFAPAEEALAEIEA
jgi:tetratricopeptide (TPR) repeat protein